MKNRVITISREFGSGGRTIGRRAGEQLGIPCYDLELIEKISEESGLLQEFIAEKSEDAPKSGLLANMFSDRSFYGMSSQGYLWTVQKKIILDLARKGPCVIVGRCADAILKEEADCLTVFVHASLERRAERIVRLYGENENAPEKRLREKDKRRSAYYHYYTDMEWGAVSNYHIALDSGVIGIEKCVELITTLY